MSISNLATGLRPGVVTSTTRPTSPYTGMIIYETDTGYLRVWDGSAWDYLSQKQDDTVGLGPVGGLVLVKTQTIGSAVTSVEVTGAFSSTYDNYLVTVNGGTATTNTPLNFRCGTTASGYRFSYLYTGLTSSPSAVGTVTGTSIDYVGFINTTGFNASFSVCSPYLAGPTIVAGFGGATGNYAGHVTGIEPNNTSFTSFTLVISAGTATGGTIRVYGYRNS
jgi:hypothetical protein